MFKFLYILTNDSIKTQWGNILAQAISPLGDVETMNEAEALQMKAKGTFDAIIIDTEDVVDSIMSRLISQLRVNRPQAHIIIVSNNCTWRRARAAFRVGATDYIYKT